MAQPGQRETILSDVDEYSRLFKAIETMESELRIRRPAADAIRLIALTGARRSEVTSLIWRHVDLKVGRIVLPPKAHKTGNRTGKPRIIMLPTEAQAILARQPGCDDPDAFVFQPAKGAGPLAIAKPWMAIRKEASLPENLGLHGLRHSLASHLAMAGASSVELMEALGHKQISTTLRYTHFAEKARSTLAQRAAAMAVAGMAEAEGRTGAAVVPIKQSRRNTAT